MPTTARRTRSSPDALRILARRTQAIYARRSAYPRPSRARRGRPRRRLRADRSGRYATCGRQFAQSFLGGHLAARSAALVIAFVSACLLASTRPAAAFESYIYGTAYDANTLQVLPDVCVVLGPTLLSCITHTDVNGKYSIKFPDNDAISAEQELHFLYRAQGYQDYNSPHFVVKGATFESAPMLKVGALPPPGCDTPGTPTRSIYLPNITRYLGGTTGWYTPFIVQNTGSTPTTLEVSFYKFTDGSRITCRKI